MTAKQFWFDLVSQKGRFGRVQFLMAESYRVVLLGICYLFYWLNLPILTMILLPFALWVGIVGTIKRFNDMELDSLYILLSLTVIGLGIGIAWQLRSWPWVFVGLGPYLLWVSLSPGKKKGLVQSSRSNSLR